MWFFIRRIIIKLRKSLQIIKENRNLRANDLDLEQKLDSHTVQQVYRMVRTGEVEDYLKGLKSGFHWSLDGHYLLSESFGMGVTFNSFFSSKAAENRVTTFADGTEEFGIKNDITIGFISPSVLSKIVSQNTKNALISKITIGYM